MGTPLLTAVSPGFVLVSCYAKPGQGHRCGVLAARCALLPLARARGPSTDLPPSRRFGETKRRGGCPEFSRVTTSRNTAHRCCLLATRCMSSFLAMQKRGMKKAAPGGAALMAKTKLKLKASFPTARRQNVRRSCRGARGNWWNYYPRPGPAADRCPGGW